MVWIMKVKGPKNQPDFVEVLYVVVFEIHGNIVKKLTILLPTTQWHFMLMKIATTTLVHNSSNTEVIPIGSENWRP